MHGQRNHEKEDDRRDSETCEVSFVSREISSHGIIVSNGSLSLVPRHAALFRTSGETRTFNLHVKIKTYDRTRHSTTRSTQYFCLVRNRLVSGQTDCEYTRETRVPIANTLRFQLRQCLWPSAIISQFCKNLLTTEIKICG